MSPLRIALILGSTRPNRISPQVGSWVKGILEKKESSNTKLSLTVVDIEAFDLPVFKEPVSPMFIRDLSKFTSQSVQLWNQEIAKYDAYVVLSPEYHQGIPGVLKNAFDFLYHAWTEKPVMIVTYGVMGGAAASESLHVVLGRGMNMKVSSISPRLEFPGRDPIKNNSSQALIEATQGNLSVETMGAWEAHRGEILQGFEELLNKVNAK